MAATLPRAGALPCKEVKVCARAVSRGGSGSRGWPPRPRAGPPTRRARASAGRRAPAQNACRRPAAWAACALHAPPSEPVRPHSSAPLPPGQKRVKATDCAPGANRLYVPANAPLRGWCAVGRASDMKVYWAHLGTVEYADGLLLQRNLRARSLAQGSSFLLLLEHTPTVTLGYRTTQRSACLLSTDELRRLGISVVATERGGA